MLRMVLWRILALLFIGIAFLGLVLPGLPATEFLLLALWCSTKGWPELQQWLMNHPKFGPMLNDWQQHKAIPQRAKVFALVSMTLSCFLLFLSDFPLWVKCTTSSIMVIVLYWLITRPTPSSTT